MTLFVLGDGEKLVVIRQLPDAALGGRFRKVHCSILLGEGESRLLNVRAWFEDTGLLSMASGHGKDSACCG